MVSLRGILKRFRPAGPPGAAAGRGVPVDRVAQRSAELEPLLVLLDDVEAEVDRIRADAADFAARCSREAAEQATAIIARAQLEAEAARAEAASRVSTETDVELAEVVREGDAALDALRARVAERMPDYVDRVVTEVRAMASELAERGQS